MAGDVDNARIWVNADVYVAPVGTTMPTTFSSPFNAATDLDPAFEALGLLSDEGGEEGRDMDTTDHFAYGGRYVRTSKSKFKRTYKITALEDNPVVFDLVNPFSQVSETGGITTRRIAVPTNQNKKAMVLVTSDGDITRVRCHEVVDVVEVASIPLADSELQKYELTFGIFADGEGFDVTELTNDPQAVPTGS